MSWRKTVFQWAAGAVVGVGATLAVSYFRAADHPPPRSSGADASRAETATNPTELAKIHQQQASELENRFQSEPRDNGWALSHEKTFREQLGAQADGGRQLVGLTCKASICKATLRWANYEQALSGYASPLEARYFFDCARSIYLSPPSGDAAAAAYDANLYFDCRAIDASAGP